MGTDRTDIKITVTLTLPSRCLLSGDRGTEEMHSGIPWYLYKVNSKVKIVLSLIFLITTGIVQHNDSMLS